VRSTATTASLPYAEENTQKMTAKVQGKIKQTKKGGRNLKLLLFLQLGSDVRRKILQDLIFAGQLKYVIIFILGGYEI